MKPKTKEEAIEMAREKALENMVKFDSCAYSTVLALQDIFDMKDEALLKAAGALTGGIGGMHDACGSLLGSALILGSVYGRGRKDDGDKGIDKIQKSIKQAGSFYTWFKEEIGTANCREIVTKFGNGVFYDFGIPDQAKAGREAGVVDKCNKMVQDSVTKVIEMLWDEMHKEATEDNPN